MAAETTEYLTTKELADLLRIKERKVYELASSGAIPCSRAVGKLLFPRDAVNAWLAAHGTGIGAAHAAARPNVFLGSHDPLLEWAIRESRCGLATQFDASLDGVERFEHGEGVVTGLHLFDPESGEWNRPTVAARFAAEPVVLVEWAWRERGLIVAPGNPKKIEGIASLDGCRVVPRQPESGSQTLLEFSLAEAGLAGAVSFVEPARSEADTATAVQNDRADAAFGLASLARQYRLDFVPVIRERFDLLVCRRAWFELPFQAFLAFAGSDACRARAEELGGYDLAGLARVQFNGS